MSNIIDKIDWEKMDNLVPAIIQNAASGEVLMLGYMNADALKQTIETKLVTFFSRSKGRIWVKGEVSKNTLSLVSVAYDCDGDAILVLAKPNGPTCHLGTKTCFCEDYQMPYKTIADLENTIQSRYEEKPEGSYVTSLFDSGLARIAQKVGEEAVESVIAAMKCDDEELKNEMADLLFHSLVLLREKNLSLSDVLAVLESRKG